MRVVVVRSRSAPPCAPSSILASDSSVVVRVSGPFTVESLSPHTTVDVTRTTSSDGGSFVEMVFDNLAKAGVQNGYRNERLDLGWIEPHAGTWVHAIGGFTDADGTDKTVAISIGPETGTVGREHIAEAAIYPA